MNMIIKTVAVGVATTLLIGGCSSGGSGGAVGRLDVVASTNVWGDVARHVAGRLSGTAVRVTSIISDPNADPHSFEASARTQLLVKKADVLIENGGGYDDFMASLRSAAGSHAPVVDAVTVSGHAGKDVNEHVWYDFAGVIRVANRIAEVFGRADPRHARDYRKNAESFDTRVQALEKGEAAVRAADAGVGVAITEPVPVYLLDACGLVVRTPTEFSSAIEEGGDVSARVLQQTLELFSGHAVRALVYNEQTSGPETEKVLDAARANNVPLVPVTETLPTGKDYLSWMTANLDAVRKALSRHG
jgi:zinc/manganese transport system substrate-binding protein